MHSELSLMHSSALSEQAFAYRLHLAYDPKKRLRNQRPCRGEENREHDISKSHQNTPLHHACFSCESGGKATHLYRREKCSGIEAGAIFVFSQGGLPLTLQMALTEEMGISIVSRCFPKNNVWKASAREARLPVK